MQAFRRVLGLALLHCLLLGEASAQVETFDTRAAFEAAAVVDVEIDLEDEASGDEWLGSTGYSDSGVFVWTSDDYLVWRHGPGAANGFLYGPTRYGERMRVDLPPGATAFGAHVATFYTRDEGTVAAVLSTGDAFVVDVNGSWIAGGANPGSSFFGVVSAQPLEWVRFEALTNDDPRDLGLDLVVIDDLLVGIGADGRSVCEVERDACQEEVEALRELAGDSDGDGESDPTDRCPDTPEGLPVDGDGCSLEQFCVGFDATSREGGKSCLMADWRNDQPLGATDCDLAKSTAPLCIPRR